MFNHRKVYAKLFEQYNEQMADAYNEILFDSSASVPAGKEGFAVLEQQVEEKMNDWIREAKLELLGGKTLAAYLLDLADDALAFDLLMHAAFICDDGVPTAVIDGLKSHKDQVAISIMTYLLQVDWEGPGSSQEAPGDDILRAAALFPVLNRWECEDVFDVILEKFVAQPQPCELLSDAFRQYMRRLQRPILLPLATALEKKIDTDDDLDGSGESILMALTRQAADTENPTAFESIKACFEFMGNKVMGAICLGDLQDPKGIPFLRGWIEDHEVQGIAPELLTELISTLAKLGDETQDLEEKFGLGSS